MTKIFTFAEKSSCFNEH